MSTKEYAMIRTYCFASMLLLLLFVDLSHQENKLHPKSDQPESEQATMRQWMAQGREKEKKDKALNCATCEVVVTVMQYDMHRAKSINETILIEKNKKKVKIPYGESRLAVIDCLEGICMYNDELRVWRADIKKGHFYRLDYNGWGQHLGDNIYGMIMSCKELIEDYDDQIADILYDDVDNAVPKICGKVAKVCDKNYHYRDLRWFLQKDGEETQEQAKEKERMAEVIRGVSETNEPQREL